MCPPIGEAAEFGEKMRNALFTQNERASAQVLDEFRSSGYIVAFQNFSQDELMQLPDAKLHKWMVDSFRLAEGGYFQGIFVFVQQIKDSETYEKFCTTASGHRIMTVFGKWMSDNPSGLSIGSWLTSNSRFPDTNNKNVYVAAMFLNSPDKVRQRAEAGNKSAKTTFEFTLKNRINLT